MRESKMNGIHGVKTIALFDTEYFTKYSAYNVYIENNDDGMPEKLDACILTHIDENALIFTYLPDNGGRNFRVTPNEYINGDVKITKLVPCDGIATRLPYDTNSSSISPHFDRDAFCKAFEDVFGKDNQCCIENLILWNCDTIKTESFILTQDLYETFYIIDTDRCVMVGWYKHLGRSNACSHKDFTLDNLHDMLELLCGELNSSKPDGWAVIENKTDTEENKNG
jgi:hypothetical protein